MSKGFESINFSDLSHRKKLFASDIDTLEKKFKDAMNFGNIETSTVSSDLCFNSNYEIIDICKNQILKDLQLKENRNAIKQDIDQINKNIKSLYDIRQKLNDEQNINVKDLNNVGRMLSKAIKKYSTNFKMNISIIEEPSEDCFIAQVTFYFNDDSKTLDFTINRTNHSIIDVNTLMFEELQNIRDQVMTENGFNTSLFIQTLKRV